MTEAIPAHTPVASTPTQAPVRPSVAMLVYPGLTLMDLIGPHTALAGAMDVHLVWKDLEEVPSDTGIALRPTTTLAQCPPDVDVLFVPGGLGHPGGPSSATVSLDEEVLTFLEERGSTARYVTSVCSGSLVLGAAGLLRGYRAATHWSAQHLLPRFGAVPVDERVVVDRNRVTGGGVTAGLDFGLTLLAEVLGPDAAAFAQLAMEYDPQPPFDAGSPTKAAPEVVAGVRAFCSHNVDDTARAAEELAERGWGRMRTPAAGASADGASAAGPPVARR